MQNPFQQQWRDCLIEHLKVLVVENRNIEGIKEALAEAGFTTSQIQHYFVEKTMQSATMVDVQAAQSFVESPDACNKP